MYTLQKSKFVRILHDSCLSVTKSPTNHKALPTIYNVSILRKTITNVAIVSKTTIKHVNILLHKPELIADCRPTLQQYVPQQKKSQILVQL